MPKPRISPEQALEQYSFNALRKWCVDQQEAGKLPAFAQVLQAIHDLGDDGRGHVMAMLTTPAKDGSPKGWAIRGRLLDQALAWIGTRPKQAVAMFWLARAGLRQREEAWAQWAAGISRPMALPSATMTEQQLEAINAAVRRDRKALDLVLFKGGYAVGGGWDPATRLPVVAIRSGGIKPPIEIRITASTDDREFAFTRGGTKSVELVLPGGRQPIGLPAEWGPQYIEDFTDHR